MTEKSLILENTRLKNGFTSIPNAIIIAKGLSIGAKLIYGLLLMFAWQESECFPGHERLAVSVEISVRQVQRYLLELRDYGLINWKRRGQNQTNIYYINDLKAVKRLKMPDMTNMSYPDATYLSCPDTTCMSHKEYSVENNVVVEGAPQLEEISKKDKSVSSTVENDGAAFDLPEIAKPQRIDKEVQTDREEKTPDEPPAWEQIRATVREVAGADISVSLAKEITKKYPPAKIDSAFSELRRQLSRGVEIRGVGAWLRYALENDIQPDQAAKAKTIPERISERRRDANIRTPRARPKGLPETSYPRTPEQEQKRRELIKSLYAG